MRSAITATVVAALLGLPAVAFTNAGGDSKPPPQKGGEHHAGDKPGSKPGDKPGDKGGEKGKDPKPMPPKAPGHAAIGAEVDKSLALNDVTGKAQKLEAYRGKITVVEFWSADASGAQLDKKTAKLLETYGKKGVAFLLVDAAKSDVDGTDTTNKRLAEHAQKSGLACPIALDKAGAWADAFGAATEGDVFVLDAKGMLAYRGALDDDPKGEKGDKCTPYLANALDALLAGKAPAQNTTPSNGAPIQRDAKPVDASGKKG